MDVRCVGGPVVLGEDLVDDEVGADLSEVLGEAPAGVVGVGDGDGPGPVAGVDRGATRPREAEAGGAAA